MERIHIPEETKRVLNLLTSAGYEAYAVGGCVRDSLLGKIPHDWDICTSARPEQMKEVFSGFRVLDTGLAHGTLTVILETPYEITTYRKDGDYSDHRHPDSVEFVSRLKEDLNRRDFTINAMAADSDGNIVDYFNGYDDLNHGLVKCVGNAAQRFEEDSLRILRAMRFASRYGFEIEPETARAMYQKRNLLREIAAERIGSEFLQIMSGQCGGLLEEFTPVLEVIIPEITPCIGFVQNNPHHDSDVWTHTIRAVKACAGGLTVKIACLYHDLGKPHCYSEDENGIGHFYGHAAVSAELAEKSMGRLRLESRLIADVVQLVASHDRILKPKKAIVRRCLNRLGEAQLLNLVYLQNADKSSQRAGTEPPLDICQFKSIVEEIKKHNDCFSLKTLAVNGSDLIELGFAPGKAIGDALSHLLELVMDDKIENDKEKLLVRAKELLNKASL